MAADPGPWQILNKRVIHTSPWGINVALWSVRLPDGHVAKDRFSNICALPSASSPSTKTGACS